MKPLVLETPDLEPRHRAFIRNARVAIIVWITLSILLAILVFTTLLVPQWLGHGPGAFTAGHMGLYQRCILDGSSSGRCTGSISDLASVSNSAFQGATVLMILACCLCVLCLVTVPLMFFYSTCRILAIAGFMQIVVAVLILITCLLFPSGWDDSRVRELCGSSARQFQLGSCRMRWVFPLAILTLFDAVALAVLALILATKLFQLVPESTCLGPKMQYNSGKFLVDDRQSVSSGAHSPKAQGARRRNGANPAVSHHF